MKNWLIWKDPVARKDWRWEEEGTTEDEMVGWHHRLNGHEFEQAPRVGGGQEAWWAAVHRVAKTEWLNWTDNDLRFTAQNWNYAYTKLIKSIFSTSKLREKNSKFKFKALSYLSPFTSCFHILPWSLAQPSHGATNSSQTTSMCCLGLTAYTVYLFSPRPNQTHPG